MQLYVSDNDCRITRPLKELKGFAKIELEPGEKKTVSFTLDKRSFAYYETSIHDYYVESGDFTIMIGASSADIRQTVPIYVEGTTDLPCHFDNFSAISDIMESRKGKEILRPVLEKVFEGMRSGESDADQLGEGGTEMMEKMIMEMPIINLSGFGIMTVEEVAGLLAAING